MVKYIDIHKAIVNRIQKHTNTECFNVDEGIIRPSFFISLDNVQASDFMNEALDRNITVRIYYFSTTVDNNEVELLNMQDKLIEIFLEDNLIKIDDYINVEVDKLDFSVVDKVLHCYFDIFISENYNRIDDKQVMQELYVNKKG